MRSKNMSPQDYKSGSVITFVIAIALTLFLLLYVMPTAAKAAKLATSNATVTGQLTRTYTSKGNGPFADYSFSVNGVTYQGRSEFSSAGPVTVHYLPEDPGYSSLDPSASAERLKSAIPILAAVILVILGLSLSLRIQWRRRSR